MPFYSGSHASLCVYRLIYIMRSSWFYAGLLRGSSILSRLLFYLGMPTVEPTQQGAHAINSHICSTSQMYAYSLQSPNIPATYQPYFRCMLSLPSSPLRPVWPSYQPRRSMSMSANTDSNSFLTPSKPMLGTKSNLLSTMYDCPYPFQSHTRQCCGNRSNPIESFSGRIVLCRSLRPSSRRFLLWLLLW